jgi:hypothetical protein
MRTTTLLAILFCAPVFAGVGERPPVQWLFWQPITDAERQLNAPIVDANAGVEAFFWKVWVSDELITDDVQRVLYHYVRLKVFNEEGKKKIATMEIPYRQNTYVTSIAARSVKADGTAVELSKDAVFERDIVRAGRLKLKAKSFAIPGVEAGSIVEYRWKETLDSTGLWYLRAQFQREYPIEQVTYFVKPLPRDITSYTMRVLSFNCKTPAFKRERDEFESVTLQKMPAFEEEPLMPAEENVRAWALIYYTDAGERPNPDEFWAKEGKRIYKDRKEAARAGNDVIAAAAEAAGGGVSTGEKAARLLRYERAHVRNFLDPGVTTAERAKVYSSMPKRRLRTAGEIFKSGLGTSREMNDLFAALGREVGLDARPARTGSRDDLLFDRRLTDSYFLDNGAVAIRDGDRWQLYDASDPLLEAGKLTWQAEGMAALVTDAKQPEFITVPATPAEDSLTSRTAKLTLEEDGTLEGDLERTWTGHSAYDRRENFQEESEAQQQERVKDEILRTYPQAEVTAIQLENVKDPERPLRVRCHVRIPLYAQRTGKRMFFQPFFFQRGVAPLLSASTRKYDVHLRYGWKEQDNVTIQLPPGFELEGAETPPPLDFGPLGSYKVRLATRKGEVIARRDFVFGREDRLVFPKSAYPTLKNAFDDIHHRDNHVLALKETAEAGGGGQ